MEIPMQQSLRSLETKYADGNKDQLMQKIENL